jgi:transcriptional regulator with XRE-family HTH domain
MARQSPHPLLPKTFGQKLFELREKNHFTQQQVGDRIRVSRSLISKWELDEIAPNIEWVRVLSKMFGVGLNYWE